MLVRHRGQGRVVEIIRGTEEAVVVDAGLEVLVMRVETEQNKDDFITDPPLHINTSPPTTRQNKQLPFPSVHLSLI